MMFHDSVVLLFTLRIFGIVADTDPTPTTQETTNGTTTTTTTAVSIFANAKDHTIRCFICINMTRDYFECPTESLKIYTCVTVPSLLNRDDIEGYRMLDVKYKCATVKYKGKMTNNMICKEKRISESGGTFTTIRGCVGYVSPYYDYCRRARAQYGSGTTCTVCNWNRCNGYNRSSIIMSNPFLSIILFAVTSY